MLKMKSLLSVATISLAMTTGVIAAESVEVAAFQSSLTGKAGDAANGKKVFVNRGLGNCLSCHQVTSIPEQSFHGEIGPSLDGVAERYSEGELRMQVVNPKVINPDTIMPAFYRVDGMHRVLKKFAGKPILTAEQVEDVVAYLKTLK